MDMPLITRAMVTDQDQDNGGVTVMLLGSVNILGFPGSSTQGNETIGDALGAGAAGVPVKCLYQGPSDPLRINQYALPLIGQYGIVAFPNSDYRGGIWLGSYLPNLADAINDDPEDASSAEIDYFSSYSGFWSFLGPDGTKVAQWPDPANPDFPGTYIIVGPDADHGGVAPELPTITRHTVDPDTQERNREEFTMDDRLAETPDHAFTMFLQHNSGTQVEIDPDGNITIIAAEGATLNISVGGTDIGIDEIGNTTIASAEGSAIELNGNTGVNLTSDAVINLTAPVVNIAGL